MYIPYINPRIKEPSHFEQLALERREAQKDLLHAEKNLEYWQSMTDCMRNRLARLNAHSSAATAATTGKP